MLQFSREKKKGGGGVEKRREWKRGKRGTYVAILGAIILQGPHQVAYQSTNTTECLARVSLKSAALQEEEENMHVSSSFNSCPAQRSQNSLRGWLVPVRFDMQTHSLMLWTVILGSEEWKDLAKVSLAAVDRGKVDRIAVERAGRKYCLLVENIDIV